MATFADELLTDISVYLQQPSSRQRFARLAGRLVDGFEEAGLVHHRRQARQREDDERARQAAVGPYLPWGHSREPDVAAVLAELGEYGPAVWLRVGDRAGARDLASRLIHTLRTRDEARHPLSLAEESMLRHRARAGLYRDPGPAYLVHSDDVTMLAKGLGVFEPELGGYAVPLLKRARRLGEGGDGQDVCSLVLRMIYGYVALAAAAVTQDPDVTTPLDPLTRDTLQDLVVRLQRVGAQTDIEQHIREHAQRLGLIVGGLTTMEPPPFGLSDAAIQEADQFLHRHETPTTS